jgi:ABC-type glycerol-3-phosphate transport system substrate-binding protein
MRKMLFMLVAVVMLITTACTTSGDKSQTETPTADGGGAQSSQEPVTITFVAKDFPAEDPNTVKLIKGIEEGMKAEGKNIKMEIVPVQSGTYSEKLGLLLQSGNIPDLIYFQGGDYQFAVTQQILEDLTPYIENSTYLKAQLNKFNLERLKNYPYLVWPAPTNTYFPIVRQDWFDKTTSGRALLENPTIDNYYNFFKELKEKNSAQFAYTTAGNLYELDAAFGQAFGLTSTWMKGSDGKYTFGATTEFEKNKLEFYAKLYKEGLLDPEYLTKKWDTKEKAFYDGQGAVIGARLGGVIDIYNNKSIAQNGESAKVMALPPAKGIAQGYIPIDVSKEGRGFSISKTSKNKELAFAVLEFMASPKGLMLDKLGVEGEEYEIVDGKIKLTEKYTAWYPHFIEHTFNFKPDKAFHPSTPYFPEPTLKAMDMVDSMSTNDNMFIMPAELAAKWDASSALYNEFAADMITGKKTGADFDEFVQAWNTAGGKEITDYANQTLK